MTLQLGIRPFRAPARSAAAMALAGASILLGACASLPPPTEQMAVSTAAVAHAVGAGAGQAVPDEMRAAQEKLARAKLAMDGKDYKRALALAEEVQVDAQLVEAKTHSRQSRKAAEQLQEDDRVLREETERQNKPTPAPRT